MRFGILLVALVVGSSTPSFAQTYIGPGGDNVPGSGLNGLSKADRKKACTMSADDMKMKGITRQQYRAACRGRPVPRG